VSCMLELVEAPALARAAALHLHDVQLDPALRVIREYGDELQDESVDNGGTMNGSGDGRAPVIPRESENVDTAASLAGRQQRAADTARLEMAKQLGLGPLPVLYADMLRELQSPSASRPASEGVQPVTGVAA